jgi:oligopeptide/dipeptide ABC transporter ATP-binding protein
MANLLLDVKNITTHFYTQDGIVKAVEDVSYNVAPGETIALVGESGCGKSVSALSILRLIQEPPGKIMSGEVNFEGVDLLKLSKSDMQKVRGAKISMIFQEPLTSLNPVLSIGRQLTEALETHMGMTTEQSQEEAIHLLDLVGIPHGKRRIKDYPHHFSGGMRQRVMIAMAISCHPKLIIADEPTTAVDVTVQAQLLELIKERAKELNTSLIIITHNLGVVARYARRVYVMYAGKIVEHGSAKDVFHYPAHPYTAGLLASVPRLDEAKKTRLIPITGQPPDLICPPVGCAFKPRCTFCEDNCANQEHNLVEISQGHFTACPAGQNGNIAWKKA